jgi:hypothetical protein
VKSTISEHKSFLKGCFLEGWDGGKQKLSSQGFQRTKGFRCPTRNQGSLKLCECSGILKRILVSRREENFSFSSRFLHAPRFYPEWFWFLFHETKTLNLSSSFVSRATNSKTFWKVVEVVGA